MMNNTIFALATAPGKSGVAIVRISGPNALAALEALTGKAPTPRMASYVAFRAPEGNIIDKGIAIYFPAPGSFTGEDVAELHAHGSRAVIRELLETLATMEGLRPAEPGEFSRRAFVNGKMDLMQAEGLADLIDAETATQKTQAMRQMQGEMSGRYEALRKQIIEALAHLEAYIDFPDEEIPESLLAQLGNEIKAVQTTIAAALADHGRGERLREGISIVILGAPNAGKSSLLNALSKREAAIVSERAGTTRDIIEVHMDMAGYPAVLVDTAGLRDTSDDIEEEGVRRARARAGAADIKLVLFDGSQLPTLDAHSMALLDDDAIVVINKSDILIHHPMGCEAAAQDPAQSLRDSQDVYYISAKTGQGIGLLEETIKERVISSFSGSAPLVTRNRHRALLSEADLRLKQAPLQARLELKCEELRLAAAAIGKITGKIAVDDILDVVFSQFCIGK